MTDTTHNNKNVPWKIFIWTIGIIFLLFSIAFASTGSNRSEISPIKSDVSDIRGDIKAINANISWITKALGGDPIK